MLTSKSQETEKAGMILDSNFNIGKTNLLVYVKFWEQACLLSLLFILNAIQLIRIVSCQQSFP